MTASMLMKSAVSARVEERVSSRTTAHRPIVPHRSSSFLIVPHRSSSFLIVPHRSSSFLIVPHRSSSF
ncbi:MAG: hypothetical protein GY822_28355, partial [Deltaproteobacteria bacterium]|nr:hypothetical protein [Deltaproteobacteria bacterium]